MSIPQIFVKVGELMSGNGSYSFASNSKSASQKFNEGTLLFPGPATIAEMEHDDYQTMTDVFSIVPMPLVEEGTVENYNTYLHNTAMLGSFNINSTKYLAMSAYIQHCSENSAEIKEEYLQVVMKFKATDFNLGTSEMLDIIYSNIEAVREMIWDNMLRARKSSIFNDAGAGDPRWHGIIKGSNFKIPVENTFLDKYDTIVALKQQAMDALVEEWAALPTTATAGE